MTTANVTVHIEAEHRRAAIAVFRVMATTIAIDRRIKARSSARRSAMKAAYHRRRR